jgi:hypothetical protein
MPRPGNDDFPLPDDDYAVARVYKTSHGICPHCNIEMSTRQIQNHLKTWVPPPAPSVEPDEPENEDVDLEQQTGEGYDWGFDDQVRYPMVSSIFANLWPRRWILTEVYHEINLLRQSQVNLHPPLNQLLDELDIRGCKTGGRI